MSDPPNHPDHAGLEAFQASLRQTAANTFRRFMQELEAESDRGAAIFAGTFFECTLKLLLEELLNKVKSTRSLLEDANGGLYTFSAKINICYSLGYITLAEYQALNVLKKIRNQFAHNFEYRFSFEDERIAAQCVSLKQELNALKGKDFETSRAMFIEAVKELHQKLFDRRYEVITFSAPAFKIEHYLDDPQAFQKLTQEQQALEEAKWMLEHESKWADKQRRAIRRNQAADKADSGKPGEQVTGN
ncbi:hypothetical protein SAMN05216464_10841 [Mucilaginibacter pineti]|uniref:Mannitol repressor n=2 Tax=Mucilaginibacter pineti TaxID=1391627 RepID=A0A1G7EII1_9SPHI|nr:hypothetical protein SAMN05216464_10841 [Mucilaginibacter pineti]